MLKIWGHPVVEMRVFPLVSRVFSLLFRPKLFLIVFLFVVVVIVVVVVDNIRRAAYFFDWMPFWSVH